MLYDTGSSHVFIDKAFAERNGIDYAPAHGYQPIQLFGSSTLAVAHTTVDLLLAPTAH